MVKIKIQKSKCSDWWSVPNVSPLYAHTSCASPSRGDDKPQGESLGNFSPFHEEQPAPDLAGCEQVREKAWGTSDHFTRNSTLQILQVVNGSPSPHSAVSVTVISATSFCLSRPSAWDRSNLLSSKTGAALHSHPFMHRRCWVDWRHRWQ